MIAWLLSVLGIGSATGAAAIFFPSLGAILALAGKAVFSWLSRRSLGEIAGVVCVLLLAVDHLALLEAHRENGKLQTQLTAALKAEHGYKAQLDSVSTKKNVQQAQTQTRIVTVTRTIRAANDKANKIETAPLPGGCKSPPEVLGADL